MFLKKINFAAVFSYYNMSVNHDRGGCDIMKMNQWTAATNEWTKNTHIEDKLFLSVK